MAWASKAVPGRSSFESKQGAPRAFGAGTFVSVGTLWRQGNDLVLARAQLAALGCRCQVARRAIAGRARASPPLCAPHGSLFSGPRRVEGRVTRETRVQQGTQPLPSPPSLHCCVSPG